ncbi:MAG: YicC family protein [Gammaproteobacteria bacterium]|nr:YicC family protein [Gammaproteobacteria bacterium]
MTNSMTAYAQAAQDTPLGDLSCELRSVNHRYLDLAPRMPEELRVFEGEIRELIGQRIKRGHIDIFIRLKESETAILEPNAPLAENLQSLLTQLHELLPSMQPIRAVDVLRWPGVMQAQKVAPEVMQAALHDVLSQALDQLVEMRAQEGAKMAELIEQRLQAMREIVDSLAEVLPDVAAAYRARLEQKLVDLKDQLDPARLEQELVMFLQKNDIAEELDRLKVHIDEVGQVLSNAEQSGRRLDFLMQELNREANTLGAKSQDQRITKASVDLKVLIEQMREQVQNIE